ncbi:PspC domain-containing protein [Novosphingobium sp.]|uniref:PspC domain-containing protein n=1 Tax=Novosphingobium sp. TaxID=1874826 RepID=UPI0038BD9981
MSDLRFEDSTVRPVASRGFRLGRDRKKVMGVCSGISDYFGIDVTLVRIAWVAGTLIGFGSLILIYLAVALIAD